jgi:hypothetical protein
MPAYSNSGPMLTGLETKKGGGTSAPPEIVHQP